MLTFKTSDEVLAFFKLKTKHIGLVPTMGSLHYGHLSLVKKACKENDFVVVSVYINPTQFNNPSDLQSYPLYLDRDKELLKPFSDQIIFYTPEHKEIYPKKIQRNSYSFGAISTHMEGFYRPGHFDGVATVIETLFKKIKPQKAYFGEKDFQQLQIIKVLNIQKKLNVNVIGCPIVREKDGLAMSSRNKLLSPNERKAAPIIYSTLRDLNQKHIKTDVSQMRQFFKEKVEQHLLKLEYFFVAPVCNLIPVSKLDSNIKYRFFVAVFAGKIRLIDTVELIRI